MPDDERFGGTHSPAGDSNGYGRRHRRADEPSEQPRRRRRSMEDGAGGLSVADLVQRHNSSRQNLSPVNPDAPGHRTPPHEGQPTPHRRPAEGQPPRPEGHRPGETTGGPQWPEHGQFPEGRRVVPPAPGQSTGHHALPDPPGRRALPDPPGFPAEPPAGHRGFPEPPGYPADLPPATGRRALPDDLDLADRPRLRGPDDGFGAPGQSSGSYPVPPAPGQHTGHRSTFDDYAPGQHTGHRAMPGHAAYDRGFGPGAAPESDYGPGLDNGFTPEPDSSFSRSAPDGFGPGGFPPDNGFDPGAAPTNGFGPGAPHDDGFGPGAPADASFGPGASDNGFGPGYAVPESGFGPGQGTGRRAMPDEGFGVDPMPGHGSGPRAVPPGPGQSSGGRALPPGHATGRGPLPEDLRGPGQSSGYRALPGRQAPGPQPGDPMGGGRPSGPGEPGGRHPSGPLPRSGDPMIDDAPPVPPARPGGDERPVGQRSTPARPSEPGGQGGVPLPPPRRPEQEAISMTTEMEAIGEEVQKRRGIDHTLARFSAVHDEIQAEERERKAKRRKLMPWRHEDDEMDKLDELVASQTIATPQKSTKAAPQPESPRRQPEPVSEELAEMLPEGDGQTRLQEKKSRRHTRSTLAIRVFAATAAILVFVATGIAWGFKSWVDASAQQVDALDPNSAAIQDAAKQRGDENFLLVGSDTRAGAEAEDGVGDEKEVLGARSDTVMIAHIPANRERAVVVSFPRDLEVSRPACEGWDPKSGEYTGEQKPAEDQVKLNTAYEIGGPMCMTKMVQKLSGLMINHFVGIDFNGFKGMVDAVNGVQVCVEKPLKDDVLGTVVPQAGKNVTLSGDQALNFVRARHVQGDLTSDYGRIIRQQRFLSSLLRKAMSTEVLLDPGKLTSFVQAFSKSTFGDNIGIEQMITLGQSLQGIEAGRVTFVTVPTVGEANDRGNEDLRTDDTKALFSAIREDSPLPGESPEGGTQQVQSGLTAAQPSGPVDPKTIKLQVLNGGNPTGGIAGGTADQLAELGYQIVWVDAAPENVDSTVIKYAKGREAQAQTLASSVPDAELVEDPSLVGAVQLIIGPGFDGKVVAPGKGGGKKPAQPLPEDLSTVNGGDVSCA